MIIREELDIRITPNADKYLLIFPNKQIMEFYKRYLQREDIIYKTECEIDNHGLVGLRYKNWDCVDETYTKQMINYKFPIIEKENNNEEI